MKIKIVNARLAFPQLFEAKTVNGEGEPAFSGAFLFAPDHPCKKEIEAGIEAVGLAKWGTKWPAIKKQMITADKTCLHNGDSKAEYAGYEGNLYVSTRNKTRPLVIDRDKSPLTAADGKPYAGCYVHASIELWAQDNKYGKRINASLMGVQFYKDGDAFAGGGSADPDDFDDIAEGAEEESLV